MRFDPHLAEFRFGYGLSPDLPGPPSPDDMLGRLAGPDAMAARFPIGGFDRSLAHMAEIHRLRAERRASPGERTKTAFLTGREKIIETLDRERNIWLGRTLARRVWTGDAFRERLVAFWADHFTAVGKSPMFLRSAAPHVETAIRPYVTGRFADLLAQAVKAPMMLEYLDQNASRGPRSEVARQAPDKKIGLNENLARELLELHTLGVDGPYGQADVRQLAELLTGLAFTSRKGTVFYKRAAEPGTETVLGKTYGGDKPSIADVDAVLEDLAHHPATAAHMARKLAVHFVSDRPDPTLVAALEARFTETQGDLMAVYEVLLAHPAAWDSAPGNIRPALDWVSAALRALAVPEAALSPEGQEVQEAQEAREDQEARARFFRRLPGALSQMGQTFERPSGPDGWPEEDAFWLTPQGVGARLQWALSVPQTILPALPDPRHFAETALGPRLTDRLRFAAAAAANRADGIGLILAAPEFQRS